MARLPTLKPRLGSLNAGVASGPKGLSASQTRDLMLPWRRWYKTARWQRLRMSVLLRDMFKCKRCGHLETNTARLVADHVTPHKGDEALFWNDTNLQTLCSSCHNSSKQSEERRGRVKGVDIDGWPIDPNHSWRKVGGSR